MFRSIAIALTATTLLLSAAQAGPAYGTVRKDVELTYRPSELSTENGARAMLARIHIAARNACGSSPTFYSSYSVTPGLARKDFAACEVDAVRSTVMKLNAPMLMKVYASNGDAVLVAGR